MAGGSRVLGSLVERDTQQPVVQAEVRLTPIVGPGTDLAMVTDRRGRFFFRSVPPGLYTLRIDCLGYRPLEDSVCIAEAAAMNLDAELVPHAIDLEPIVVTARSTLLPHLIGFEEQRFQTLGRIRCEHLRRNGAVVIWTRRGS